MTGGVAPGIVRELVKVAEAAKTAVAAGGEAPTNLVIPKARGRPPTPGGKNALKRCVTKTHFGNSAFCTWRVIELVRSFSNKDKTPKHAFLEKACAKFNRRGKRFVWFCVRFFFCLGKWGGEGGEGTTCTWGTHASNDGHQRRYVTSCAYTTAGQKH